MSFRSIANIFSCIGAILLACSTFSKKKEKMLFVQVANTFCGAISNLLIGSYAGMTTNIICMFRNYLNAKKKNNMLINIVIVFSMIIFGIHANRIGVIGIIPILASVEYTILSYMSKNSQGIRFALCINQILWFIHDIFMGLYPSAIMEIVILIIVIVNCIKYRRNGYMYNFNQFQEDSRKINIGTRLNHYGNECEVVEMTIAYHDMMAHLSFAVINGMKTGVDGWYSVHSLLEDKNISIMNDVEPIFIPTLN